MKIHFRILEVEDQQVLIERSANHEDGEYVEVVMHLDGLRAAVKMGFKDNEDRADTAFESYTVEKAKELREQFVKSFEE